MDLLQLTVKNCRIGRVIRRSLSAGEALLWQRVSSVRITAEPYAAIRCLDSLGGSFVVDFEKRGQPPVDRKMTDGSDQLVKFETHG